MSAAAGGTTPFAELPGITPTCTEHSLLASGGNLFMNEKNVNLVGFFFF